MSEKKNRKPTPEALDDDILQTGAVKLDDDELEAVAGGISATDMRMYKKQAEADGRKARLRALDCRLHGLCDCAYGTKWARESDRGGFRYFDIKCYKCGETWASWHSHGKVEK